MIEIKSNIELKINGIDLTLSQQDANELYTLLGAVLGKGLTTPTPTPMPPLGPAPVTQPWSWPMYPSCADWTVRPDHMPSYSTTYAGRSGTTYQVNPALAGTVRVGTVDG